MKKKILIPLLVLAMLVCAFALSALATDGGETTNVAFEIAKKSISLKDNVYVNFKVSLPTDADESTLRLLVWEGTPTDVNYTKETAGAATLSPAGIESATGYYVFQYTDVSAREMGKTLYARAYYETETETVYTAPVRYSVAEYIYNMEAKENAKKTDDDETTVADEDLIALLGGLKQYGALAQTYFAGEGETPVLITGGMYTITVTGGTLSDGFTTGKFLNGASITLTGAEYFHCGTERLENNTVTVSADAEYVACTRESGSCNACGYIDATAMTADELKAAVADQLAAGETDITVTLKPDAPAEMITAIRRAICDTEGIADGSINLTLKGVTTIPGTTNWDGVAFGPRNAQWDENNVEIVSHEEVTQLASINLPDVTEIGAQAFLDCSNLTSITAPKVQSIGDWGLQSTAITSIDMPLLKEAGYSAFCRTALTEVSLPSLETAGVIVFGHCEQLRTVDLPKLQNLSQQLFTRCTSLVSVSAPAATSMGINVFKGCSELVSITLPGVTELTNEAFAECTKLENITLGSVITKVNVNLFAGEALSSGITLTLNCGQENAETLPAAAGTNVEWAGFTWKEVKFSATE